MSYSTTSITGESYRGGHNPRLSPAYYNHPQKIQGHSFCRQFATPRVAF